MKTLDDVLALERLTVDRREAALLGRARTAAPDGARGIQSANPRSQQYVNP